MNEPEGSHLLALGRMEGKVETILSLLTSVTTRTDALADRVNVNDKRIATLEAKADTKSDTTRFWITTILSLAAALVALAALGKDIFIK